MVQNGLQSTLPTHGATTKLVLKNVSNGYRTMNIGYSTVQNAHLITHTGQTQTNPSASSPPALSGKATKPTVITTSHIVQLH